MLGEALFYRNTASSLFDGCENSFTVDGANGQEIDDLGRNPLGRQFVGGLQALANFFAVGNDGNIGSLSLDLGLTDLDHKVLGLGFVGHGEGNTVHQFVFQNHDWVGIPNGGLDQSLGVLTGIGRDNLKTGDGSEPSGKTLRVLGGGTGTVSVGTTEDNGNGQVSPTHIILFGRTVDNVVDSLHTEIDGHEFDDRSEVLQGGSDCHPCESGLCDGCVDDTLFSVLLVKALGDLVGTLVLGDFLSHDEDGFVALHFFVESLIDSLADRHLLCCKSSDESILSTGLFVY
ncbi:unnamed protein product [Pseudo-nitzschia multistriata]|uniref:Uncharacterized protein n=1 Tax=Pseudo-nitzschia multistriata TaxID=183589 RepID=A0A448ZSM8_9STRA|nr:unnamed protein product [Pseudo-nitzschia multistriata]